MLNTIPWRNNETNCLWISLCDMAMTAHMRSTMLTAGQSARDRARLEQAILWFKDAAAGLCLVAVLASAYFVL
jgi:hypothetical protein